MLTSLPPIVPRDAHTLWSPAALSPPPEPASTNPSGQQRRTQPTRNPVLAAIDAEEEALAARKANVRRFGSTWIRPPGVSKTYQAMVDEAAERAEQEAIARREAAMAEQQAAAEEEARRGRVGGVDGMDGEEEGMERDLDEEVPEADDGRTESDVGGDGTVEVDLDADVPEAGSYEHTDTELEDESSEDELASPGQMAEETVAPGSAGSGQGPTVVQSTRMPIPAEFPGNHAVGPSEELDSSMVVSSPTVARPQRRAQAQRTRGTPNRGRENQRTS